MRITKRDVVFWMLVGVPCAVILCWLLLVLLWLELVDMLRRLVNWLFAEHCPPLARRKVGLAIHRQCPCACCGHQKSAHENGVDGCVADGCDCRGFSGRDAG